MTPRFGGGNFRLGLLDVENDVSIVESDWIEPSPTDLAWDQLSSPPKLPEEPRHIRIKIPSSVGRKAYRLVVQPTQDTRAATFWATGQITFPSVSLGGTYMTWFTPTEGASLTGWVPNAVEAHIDWSMLRNPINTVIADITLLVSYPVFHSRERCRAIILYVGDGGRMTTSWIDVSWIGGIMASARPYPGPVMRQLKLELPRQRGTHTYVLEVEVSKARMSATATGTLSLRH